LMKILKVRSYIRLVLVFYIIFAVFFIIQSVVLHFGITRNIMPFYFGEKKEMALHIKHEIILEASRNPNFDLEKYIAKQNRGFSRLKLGFISKSHQTPEKNRFSIRYQYKAYPPGGALPGPPPGMMGSVPLVLNTRGRNYNGYLILFSNRFQALNNRTNIFFGFMLATLLPPLIFGFFISRNAYRKSSILVEAVEKVSRGDYQTRVTLTGDDEYSQIAKAFNKMASSIETNTQKLKDMDQQRRQFIADISHELATPLTAIKGYVETLRMEDFNSSEAEQRQYLGIVWDETERLSLLVKDLLEQARMDAGTMTLEPAWIDCEEFLKVFSNRNSLVLKKKGVVLEWQVETGQFIYADYRRLEQILQNLLENALRYSKGITKVFIALNENNENTILTIGDDGAGISPEHLGRIFERFYKAPFVSGFLPENSGSASGLGLSIVKGLVELHGGKITVSNIEGKTIFTLEFPRLKEMSL
jgi:signal transduction histidine kinase